MRYYSILLKFFIATESRSIINVHMHDKLTQEKPNAANVNNLRDARGTKTQNISEMK